MKPLMHTALDAFNDKRRQSYSAEPGLLEEHHGIEQSVLAGGYSYRQILELVQNGADAILEAHERGTPPADGNRIHVLLRDGHLYVANTGARLSEDGAVEGVGAPCPTARTLGGLTLRESA